MSAVRISSGINSFTTTSASFVVPAVGASVAVSVVDASWMVIGQMVAVETAGGSPTDAYSFKVAAKTGNLVTLQNVGGGTVWLPGLPKNYLSGCLLSNGTDTVNDINVGAGVCRDSTDTYDITISATTKQLDAAWVAGTNVGGRDTGAISDNWWHVFAIYNPGTGVSDVLFSLSLVSPTYPSGYTAKRRIGSILRNATYGGIRQFYQAGDFFQWNPVDNELNGIAVGPPSAVNYTVWAPLGFKVQVVFQYALANNTVATATASVRDPDQTSDIQGVIQTQAVNTFARGHFILTTNTSAQLAYNYAAGSGVMTLYGGVSGWWDLRGTEGYALY